MENSKIVTIQSAGADAKGIIRPVTIEVEAKDNGIGIHLVGLADAQVKETLLRTVTALQACGFRIPGKKVIINIAPATIYKRGSNYDLPIAIGILQASGQIKVDEGLLERCVFSGELGLDGTIREGEPYQGYAIAMASLKLLGEKPVCLCTCKETALQAAVAPKGILPYGFTHISNLLRVLQHAIVGTSNIIWYSDLWRQVGENIKVAKEVSQHPL